MSSDPSPPSVTAYPPAPGGRASRGLLPRAALRLPPRVAGRPRSRRSIRTRIAILALALGLPFIASVAGTAVHQATIERASAKQHALSLAKLFAARVDDYVSDMVATLALVKQGVVPSAVRVAANDAYLRRVWDELPPSIHDVGVWTLDGRNVGALIRHDPAEDRSIAEQKYFRDAIATGDLTVAGPLASPWTGQPIVVFARPIRDAAGGATGVITLSASLTDLRWLLDLNGTAPPGTVVSIMTPAGDILARNLEPERFVGTNVLDVGNVRANLARGEGVDDAPGADRLPRIGGFTRASRVPWHVFVGLPEDVALASARHNVTQTLAFGALSLLLGALFAVRVGTRIAAPLRRLALDATVLARGHFGHRSSVEGDDETGVLARTLNRLAQTVEDRTRALQEKAVALEDKSTALAASEKRMRMVADNLPALVAYLDHDLVYRFVNARASQIFGMPHEALLGRSVESLLPPDAYAQSKPHLARALGGERARFQRGVVRRGEHHHELVELIPDQDASGAVLGLYALVQDVTDLRAAQHKAEASEERLQRITDSIPSMVGYIDRERRYRFNSHYYETWLGKPLREITGRPVRDVLGEATYASIAENLDRAFAGERVDFEVEVRHGATSRFRSGSYIPVVDAAGRVVGVYTSSTDVTPMKEVERQLARLAQKDTLTGLPNRHAFNDAIAAALARAARTATEVALMFLDVDAFKPINDTLGHAAGDAVLREFARRLQASVRPTDLVARLAGDEFVIVLEGVHSRDECRAIARKIILAMRPVFCPGDARIRVTTSIGVAMGRGGATSAEALLRRADSALYAAKGRGRDTYEIAL
jgi:diguanylate cyclase (GGDEF)-like protein/PAS domain S-box-containing protein